MNQPISDGDIYVNDGESFDNGVYYPGEPQERTEAESANAAKLIQSAPVLDEVNKWFASQIDSCDRISNMQISKMTVNGVQYSRTVSVEAQVLAYQLLKELLETKAREFKDVGAES